MRVRTTCPLLFDRQFQNFGGRRLEKRIKRCATWQQNSKRMSKKLYILIPESCLCHPCLSDVDGNIRYQENLEELSMNRAGNHQRVYKNSIYQVTSDEVYYFIGEYATVVQAMYEMEMGRIAGLTSDEKKLQVVRFHKTLLSVLNHGHASECHGTFKLLFYCDNPKEDQYVKLSELIIQEIKADLGQSDLVAEVLDARDIVS